MEPYNIQQPSTRRCAATGREFAPGEAYVAALFPLDGASDGYVERDYAASVWAQNPLPDAVAVWRGRVPAANADPPRSRRAVNDVLLGMFDHLTETGLEPDKRYILALLLIRRRVMRLEEPMFADESETLSLGHTRRDETYRVPVVVPTPEREAEIQRLLTFVLQGNEPGNFVDVPPPDDAPPMQIWTPDDQELPEVVDLPPDIDKPTTVPTREK